MGYSGATVPDSAPASPNNTYNLNGGGSSVNSWQVCGGYTLDIARGAVLWRLWLMAYLHAHSFSHLIYNT
ncbi:hypothetical protein AA0481_2447 [Acetobacter orientalis NRIC 0481]|uniref:Uncharacterized protein n=1 Tax=Acetobacter orientalis TaxID=146474 RepID=A0A0D6NH50_9PROT|nr:hypothetical protein Abor_001_043 [Acetobacter orientalis]GBR21703.1 hypothetical protein AA0481_2447 [Acetobacter orientalis NRIC 0481]GEL62116.1 hypothetical protein AOR02nite_19580 [Acetobacter orientalis]